MTDALMLKGGALAKLEKSLDRGGLDELVASQRFSMLLVDVSDSMSETIRHTGKRKIDQLREVVTAMRQTHPVPVAAFGLSGALGAVAMVDTIPEPQGMTPLHLAFDFARQSGATHVVVVSDGQPDSEALALEAAVKFGGPIDVFFVGNPGEYGADLLARIAKASGGACNVVSLAEDTKKLAGKITLLLGEGQRALPEPKSAILL